MANSAPTAIPSAKPWWTLLAFVVACELVGVIGAATTDTGTSAWYLALAKPAFQPPGWVFGPAWTLLYALMGIAAWRVWSSGAAARDKRRALTFFGIQLALNAAWTPVFFGAHWIGAALVILLLLWLFLVGTMAAFRRVDPIAMWLLLPYLAWVTFATILNAAILNLN